MAEYISMQTVVDQDALKQRSHMLQELAHQPSVVAYNA